MERPELIRINGQVRVAENAAFAEECFHHSLRLAREQGARSWALRTATSLAGLWCDQGRHKQA
jgi:hypothetical protein